MTRSISTFLSVPTLNHLIANGRKNPTWGLCWLLACGPSNSIATHSVDVGQKEPTSSTEDVTSSAATSEEPNEDAPSGSGPMLHEMDEDSLLLQPNTLDDWERQILANQLRELRSGVQLFQSRRALACAPASKKGPLNLHVEPLLDPPQGFWLTANISCGLN